MRKLLVAVCVAVLVAGIAIGIGTSHSGASADPASGALSAKPMTAGAFSPYGDASHYRPGPFESVGDAADMDAIRAVVRSSVETEDAAMLARNYQRAADFKQEDRALFTNTYGYLDRQTSYIDINREINDSYGYAETVRQTTRLDFKAIVVDGPNARAIVEQESLVVREPVGPSFPVSDGGRPTLTLKTGRQLDIMLEMQGDRWVISAERFEFLPGMEPNNNMATTS